MRLAYLIIAHNEFDVLHRLVAALDDERCDIYIHFDAKVKTLPNILTQMSSLHILEKRVNVRWGTVSQIEAEYALWEEAVKYGPYEQYILLSGTHFPLVPHDDVVSYFAAREGQVLVPKMEQANAYQVDMKMRRLNFLPGTTFWKAMLKIQRVLHIRCHRGVEFYNGGNWVALTQEAAEWLLSHRRSILRKYRWTFCGDEFFVPTELMASPLRDTVVFSSDLLKFEIGRSNAKVYSIEDYDELMASGCIFARKLTMENSQSLIERLEK